MKSVVLVSLLIGALALSATADVYPTLSCMSSCTSLTADVECSLVDSAVKTGCMSSCSIDDRTTYGAVYVANSCGTSAAFLAAVATNAPPTPPPPVAAQPPSGGSGGGVATMNACMSTCVLTQPSNGTEATPAQVCTMVDNVIATGCMGSCSDTVLAEFGAQYENHTCGTVDSFLSLVNGAGRAAQSEVVVSATITLDSYTVDSFDSTAQANFESGIADAVGVEAGDVKVTDVNSARRHLLAGISVKFTISIKGSAGSVATLTKTVTGKLSGAAAIAAIVTSLQNAGLSVTSITVTGVSAQSKTSFYSASAMYSSAFAMIASAALVLIASA